MKNLGVNTIRIRCPPKREGEMIKVYLGDASPHTIIRRVGFNSHCICIDCLHQFDADLRDEYNNPYRRWLRGIPMKDERRCPRCSSRNIKTLHELVNNHCPRCREGIIIKEIIGCIPT